MSKRDVAPGQPQFVICDHKGVQMTFANEVIISIQWGPGNYCADYWDFSSSMDDYSAPRKAEFWRSPDAEIALFWSNQPKKEWLTREAYAALNDGKDCGDDVLPAVSPDEVARYIAWAVAHPAREAK